MTATKIPMRQSWRGQEVWGYVVIAEDGSAEFTPDPSAEPKVKSSDSA